MHVSNTHNTDPFEVPAPAVSQARPSAQVGVPAGVVAGVVFLVAQILFAMLQDGVEGGAQPVARIAAILMGPDVARPPIEWHSAVVGMALIIHLPMAAIYGRIIDVLVMQISNLLAAALAGAVAGALIYVLHHWFIAPELFPWFETARNVSTALDHVLFGVVAALVCVGLRRRLKLR